MSEPYDEGYEAFGKTIKQEENPYMSDPAKRTSWDNGWEDAKIEVEQQRSHTCHEDRADRL
ncbi:MAG TPA: hypothetical protein VE890_08485 [Thermoguttaceae bacterium]|nr:hypothetical protein [Thermoguttaceae bacterium]